VQGTALAASASRISPDTAASLELLGIVTLTNRKSELSWSEDSKLVIAAGNTGVQGYSLTNLVEERSLFAGTNVICLAFSPGQEVLAGGTLSGEAILWQTERGNIEQRFQFTENEFDIASDDRCSIIYSLDGKELYTASTLDKEINVWDPGSGKLISSIESTGLIKALALSPDGQTLAAGTSAGTISFYDLLNHNQARLLQPNHASKISGLAYSPDGSTLAYIFDDGYFQNVRADTLETGVSRTLGMGEGAGLAYSPDGSLLAVGSNADLLGVFLPGEMQLVTSLNFKSLVNIQGTRMYLAFSPDGRYLAGTFKNYLYIWGIR
jgi:WD40 repeat protein